MSNTASRITEGYPELLDEQTRELIDWMDKHPKKLKVEYVADVEHSKALNEVRSGAVIISASGMCEAGRIKYHLRENLSRSECSILIAGFQAAGTLGRRLVDGAIRVRLFGEDHKVRASIHTIGGLSAHTDQQGLIAWYGHFTGRPPLVLVHGEDRAREALAGEIGQRSGASVMLARPGMCCQV